MLWHDMQDKALLSGATVENADLLAGCLAVLTAEARRLGLRRDVALRLLCDAPARIAAAMEKGPDALVVWRLDREAPSALVSGDDGRLGRFMARANDDGAGIIGLNPAKIAAALAATSGAGLPVSAKVGGRCDRAYH